MLRVVLKDMTSQELWHMLMPCAPIIGSVVTVTFPDNIVHKVVRAVNYDCTGAEIRPENMPANRNEIPLPWNPNNYPECTIMVYGTDAVWDQSQQRWADPLSY